MGLDNTADKGVRFQPADKKQKKEKAEGGVGLAQLSVCFLGVSCRACSRMEEVTGGWVCCFVKDIIPGSVASAEGSLRHLDIIHYINGVPTKDLTLEREPQTPAAVTEESQSQSHTGELLASPSHYPYYFQVLERYF